MREAASREWALWEDTHISIGVGGFRRDTRWEDQRFRHAFVRLTTHYWSHDGFCEPPILEQMARLDGIPGVLIHGRRDISSPAAIAWELHRRWRGSTLHIDDSNGHGGNSMARPGVRQTTNSPPSSGNDRARQGGWPDLPHFAASRAPLVDRRRGSHSWSASAV